MKKTIAVILAMITLLCVLASCAETNAPETKTPAGTTATVTTAAETTAASEDVGTTDTPATETAQPTQPAETTETPAEPSTETPVTTETPVPADPMEVLKGKKALFCGDSIVMASTYDKDHQWWGWAGRIKEYYGLKSYKNAGVDGASVSNCRSNNQIISQVQGNKNTKYDFVILEGGTNDAWDVVNVGRMIAKPASETAVADFDLSTFCGGLENLLYYAKKNYPDATIGYIITTQMNNTVGCVSEMRRYVEATKAICEKWGVPYLDTYNDSTFIKEYQPIKKKDNTPDGIHPNSAGYEIYTRYIAQFMADIFGKTYEEHYEAKPLMADVAGVLTGKTVAFYGDSIGAITSHDTKQLSYAGRIAETYGAQSDNNCVSGASVSTIRGSNTVYNQLKGDRRKDFDIIVLEGGVNDAWDTAPIGELCDEVSLEHYDEKKLDLSTLAGGLEQLFYEIKHHHAESLTFYVINYKMGSSAGSLGNMTKYVKLIKAACDKWGIPYLDLYTDGFVNSKFLAKTSKNYIADGIHPNDAGYDLLAELIAEFAADEYVKRFPVTVE